MTWRGYTANYTKAEQEIMRRLREGCTAEELAFVHEAKSRFDGTLREKA